MQVRVLKKENEKSIRIYRFDTETEMNKVVYDLKIKYPNNVKIFFEGQYSPITKNMINSMADDDAYKELNLTMGDYCILTNENILGKIEDDRKTNKISVTTKHGDRSSIKNWTTSEISSLWLGSTSEVAKLLGRTKNSVGNRRGKFLKENPSFIPPKFIKKIDAEFKWNQEKDKFLMQNGLAFTCKQFGISEETGEKRINFILSNNNSLKQELNKINMENQFNELPQGEHGNSGRKIKRWTPEELEIAYSDLPLAEIAKKLNRTYQAVSFQRAQRSFSDKKPKVKTVIPEEVKKQITAYFWSKKELDLLWTAPKEEVAIILNRPVSQVYAKRATFLRNNPGFIIPEVALSKNKKGKNKLNHKKLKETPAKGTFKDVTKHDLAVDKSVVAGLNLAEETKELFKCKINGVDIVLAEQPKKLTVGDIQIEF